MLEYKPLKHNKRVMIDGDEVHIQLSTDVWTTIDKEFIHLVDEYCWYATKRNNGDHQASSNNYHSGKRNQVYIQNLIVLDCIPGITVDRIDRDPLNNRRSNLRRSTRKQQLLNRVRKNSLGAIGVRELPSGRYAASGNATGKTVHISTHNTISEAARARDQFML